MRAPFQCSNGIHLCRISVMFRCEIRKDFVAEFLGVVACHRQVKVEIVTAAVRRRARDIRIVVPDKRKHILHKIVDIR